MPALGFGPSLALRLRRSTAAVFDFSGATLPAGATLARGSVATRINAGGALASEAADIARFDYAPVGLAYRGLLIEGAATNAVPSSRDLTVSWVRTGLVASATALIEDATTAFHNAGQAVALTSGAAVTLSAIAAEIAGSAKRYLVLFGPSAAFGSNSGACFDLASGGFTTTGPGVTGAGSAALGGGAWLCWVTLLPTASISANLSLRLSVSASGLGTSFAGDGTSGITAGNVQVEGGGVATSRIVTSGAAATRSADVLTLAWGGRGVGDGAVTVRYTFDDASTQDVAATVAGGSAAVPTTLARPRILRAVV